MAWSIYEVYSDLIGYITNVLIRITLSVLSSGPVPRHVAFVMDGNRRYARRQGRKVQEGHVDGFGAFHRVSDAQLHSNSEILIALSRSATCACVSKSLA